MGQYQQWLFAQEVDRHLRAERETLETELLYLHDRIAIMEQAVPEAANVLLQALEAQACAERGQADEQGMEPAWGGLPKVETPRTQAGERRNAPGFSAKKQRAGDLQTFFDDQRQTDPTLAAWTAHGGTRAAGSEHVADEETRRLNENVRRWFIRWRRQLVAPERPEEVQND